MTSCCDVMASSNDSPLPAISSRLRPYWVALLLGMMTLLYGFGIGIAFGAGEQAMKDSLTARANTVLEQKYGSDQTKAQAAVSKSLTYVKRAHLHAGGLGTASLVLILLLALACPANHATRAMAVMLGAGALGYSVYWLVAGFAAPALGGTGAAKEAYAWLAMPSAGAIVLSTLGTLLLVTYSLASPPESTQEVALKNRKRSACHSPIFPAKNRILQHCIR